MNDFEKGFKYISDNMSSAVGAVHTQDWIGAFDEEQSKLISDLMEKAMQANTDAGKLQGNIFEIFAARTLNMNSLLNHHGAPAHVPDVNTLGSADVVVNGEGSQLKSFSGASQSYRALAETPYERYMSLAAKAAKKGKPFMTLEEYLQKNNIKKEDMHKSLYVGQYKVLPTDQLDKAIELATKAMARAEAKGNYELAQRYKEVLDTLRDTVKNGNDSSAKITRAQLQKLAEASKGLNEGELKELLENELNISFEKLVKENPSVIAKEALYAGLNAAVISLVISIAPVLLNGISKLIKEGEIDKNDLAELGYAGLKGSAKGFINGALTSAIVTCCKANVFGSALENINPSVISTFVVLSIGTIESSIKFATGKIDKAEMVEEICRLYVITGFSVGTGLAFSSIISLTPLQSLSSFAYMLGSFIGSLIGNYVFDTTKNLFMSLCVEHGFTFFGLVEQNYTIPDSVLKEIGTDIFNFDQFEFTTFEYEEFTFDTFDFEQFEYDTFEITPMKRGLVKIHKVAYL